MIGKFGKRDHKDTKDRYYTDPDEAKRFVDMVDRRYGMENFSLCIEPSAGSGSFSQHLPRDNSVFYDIAPTIDGIIKQDYFTVSHDPDNILVIGNPPFGRVSSTAIRFFNHSANFAKVIAFIIPQTFHRVSVQNKLDLNFRMVYNEDIDGCIFIPEMPAKCSFQIWERFQEPRDKVVLKTTHPDWVFLPLGNKDKNKQPTPPENPSFAIGAYGVKVGRIVESGLDKLRPKSWHWIKTDYKDELICRFGKLDYSIAEKTVRQPSLGRGELVQLYEGSYTELNLMGNLEDFLKC
jgi:hypothetical protein